MHITVPSAIDDAAQGAQDAQDRVNEVNGFQRGVAESMRQQWSSFWNPQSTVAQMQSQLDMLWNTPVPDNPLKAPNALAALFLGNTAWTQFLLSLDPHAFDDARKSKDGTLTEFLNAGWTLTPRDGGGYIAIAPVTYV